ncbi:MAG TPA: EamA family transporter [Bacteroidetes bacterium]|nr:EamA family transporter [Bacteroidota bacterium]
MQTEAKAHIFILGANIIYGLNYVIAKVALNVIPAFPLVLTRVAIPLLFYAVFALVFQREKVDRKDHWAFFYCGFLGVAANQMMFISGLDRTSEIHASLIMITTPILVLLIASIVLKERLTWRKIAGVLIGAAGVYLLIQSSEKSGASTATVAGDLLIMGNAMSYAFFLVLAKPLMRKYNPYTAAFWFFLYGLVFVAPFGVAQLDQIPPEAFSGNVLLSWLYVVFISTLLVYILNILGLKFGSPSLVSIYIYTQPLLAALIAVLLGKDTFTAAMAAAALFIFTGVAMVSFSQKKRKQRIA